MYECGKKRNNGKHAVSCLTCTGSGYQADDHSTWNGLHPDRDENEQLVFTTWGSTGPGKLADSAFGELYIDRPLSPEFVKKMKARLNKKEGK